MTNKSPPSPFEVGSITFKTAFAAIAASIADPPCSSTRAPVCDAATWLVATMPYCVATTDRPYDRSCAAPQIEQKVKARNVTTNFREFIRNLMAMEQNWN